MESIILKLEEFGTLGAGEHAALRAMDGIAAVRTLRKGESLIEQGMVPDFTAFVEHGLLRHLVIDPSGDERIICFHREGSFIEDCQRWARNEPADYSVVAIEECRLIQFPMAEVDALTDGHPGFDAIGARMMMTGRDALMNHIAMLQRFDPLERYRYILENDPELVRRVSVTHLAQYLGLTRETLSRVRGRIMEYPIS